jgi:hypothetical protein
MAASSGDSARVIPLHEQRERLVFRADLRAYAERESTYEGSFGPVIDSIHPAAPRIRGERDSGAATRSAHRGSDDARTVSWLRRVVNSGGRHAAAVSSWRDPHGMHGLWLRPVPMPGLR